MKSRDTLDILLISTADWDNPYWTNKQHVALRIAAQGHRVFYIESQGLRSPTATSKDVKRIRNRFKRGLAPPRKVRDTLFVWSPIVVPLHNKLFVRKINRIILKAGVEFWCWAYKVKPVILWTYSPLTTNLYDISKYPLVVYHAVDDIKVQPGMPRQAIAEAEDELSRRADIVFATSNTIYTTHKKRNFCTYYFSNVADYAHFNKALDKTTVVPHDISSIPRPRLGFIGAVSTYKLNFDMIKKIASDNPNWSFVFIGEIGEGDPSTDPAIFNGLCNVHLLGGRPYSSLPGYLKAIDVALLPNKLNDYTKAMFPMKFFEYLASGRPVVSVRLPALSDYDDVAILSDGPEDFASAIRRALSGEGASLQRRLEIAREHTYELRTEKMMRIVMDTLTRKRNVNAEVDRT